MHAVCLNDTEGYGQLIAHFVLCCPPLLYSLTHTHVVHTAEATTAPTLTRPDAEGRRLGATQRILRSDGIIAIFTPAKVN